MPLAGRGTSYSKTRHIVEGVLAHLYSGGWPARVARAAGFQRGVRTLRHEVAVARANWPAHAPRLRIAFCAEPPVTRVLLMHAPSGLLAIGERAFDVAFCGHTHGGHIALPGGVPIVATGPLSRRYSHGRFRLARRGASTSTLFVSRGIGGSEVPLRLFAEPDVVVCDLRC